MAKPRLVHTRHENTTAASSLIRPAELDVFLKGGFKDTLCASFCSFSTGSRSLVFHIFHGVFFSMR